MKMTETSSARRVVTHAVSFSISLLLLMVAGWFSPEANAQPVEVKLSELSENPNDYKNAELSVKGTVSGWMKTEGIQGMKYLQLRNNFGDSIIVRTAEERPQVGSTATFHGQMVMDTELQKMVFYGSTPRGGGIIGNIPAGAFWAAGAGLLLLLVGLVLLLRESSGGVVESAEPRQEPSATGAPGGGTSPAAPQPAQNQSPAPASQPVGGEASTEGLKKTQKVETEKFTAHQPSQEGGSTLKMLPGKLTLQEGSSTQDIFLYELENPPEFTIGRQSAEDLGLSGNQKMKHIQIDHPGVSRPHAKLRYEDGEYKLTCVSDVNPIVVDGKTFHNNESTTISDGTKIQIGECKLLYQKR